MNNGKIAVIGAGKWGQALHFALNKKKKKKKQKKKQNKK